LLFSRAGGKRKKEPHSLRGQKGEVTMKKKGELLSCGRRKWTGKGRSQLSKKGDSFDLFERGKEGWT